jgi:hypothetical protein
VSSRLRRLVPNGVKIAGRRQWVHLARSIGYPISTQLLPRPPLVRGRRPLRLTHALVACDLNPVYLDFWPLVSRAWNEIAGLDVVLVLIAGEEDVPPELRRDPRVRLFPPIEGLHTAFQAQCIRLLYPALLDAEGAVIISDMELMPLSPAYFHGSLARLDARFFVSYRDVLHSRGEIAIAYSAAEPATWRDITGVADDDDVRRLLSAWHGGVDYAGVRGGSGWYTDQHVLYRMLMDWPERDQRLWMLDDDYTGHRRLERSTLEQEGRLTVDRRRELLALRYTDFNALVPYERFRDLNEGVVSTAMRAVQSAARGIRPRPGPLR